MSGEQSGYALKRKQSKLAVSAADERALETRNAIVLAARDVLLENGYAATRVEDIIKRAAISRPTFYRYFSDKFEVAKAYHALSRGANLAPWIALADLDFRDTQAIRGWFEGLLDMTAAMRDEIVVWAEMSAVEPDYLLRMPRQMPEVIERLGNTIPAFAVAHRQGPAGELSDDAAKPGPVWVEAYLMLEHVSLYCSWLTLGKHTLTREQTIDYFCGQVLRFIQRYDDPSAPG